jgi:hypothetical protein
MEGVAKIKCPPLSCMWYEHGFHLLIERIERGATS